MARKKAKVANKRKKVDDGQEESDTGSLESRKRVQKAAQKLARRQMKADQPADAKNAGLQTSLLSVLKVTQVKSVGPRQDLVSTIPE